LRLYLSLFFLKKGNLIILSLFWALFNWKP